MNDLKKIEQEVDKANSLAAIEIKTQIDYEKASAISKGLRELKKTISDAFDPIIKKAHGAWKEAIAQKDKYFEPVESAQKIVDGKVTTYLLECEKKRREAELKAQQEAEEKARKEREKLEAKAAKQEAKGNGEVAEALKEQAAQVEVIVPTVAPVVNHANGQSLRKRWYARVIDFKVLADDYKLPNQSMLDGIAVSTKGQVKISGVEFYEKASLSQR